MDWILYLLLVLAAAGDILLAVVLAKVMRKNAGPEQKIDTADDFVRAVTPVLQSETDLLAEQLRAMQGESARTTSATLRDFSAVLAENQRQSAANSTARLEAIDRAGAARQRAANDALLAQLTRHRIASFSVQSQRYVSMAKGFDYVIPPAIEALGESEKQEFIRQMDTIHEWYCHWQEKLGGAKESANEDARFVLPNAASTRLLVTMNARELMHFFSLRCCNRAQWEIREMAWQMLTLCKQAAPALFEHAGPACVSGVCPEGKNTCGKMAEVREKAKSL